MTFGESSTANSSRYKRYFWICTLTSLLVFLTLFLAHRLLSPSYERKETVASNKLGLFHTQLAAERLGARLGTLREELKENGLRLVDSSRGPVNLDSTRWLWLRIQDRDWRAPNYLEPLPASKSDVDSWAVSVAKSSLVLSERVPIVREGVQDFVLVEGGLRTTVLDDLQTDPNFGLWVFDLEAYKNGGLSVAKVFEKISGAGALSKEELQLLTSDLLTRLFQDPEVSTLESQVPWSLTFKNSSGPSRLGILGYWAPQTPAINMTSTWISLGLALLVLSLLISFLILRMSKVESETLEEEVLIQRATPQILQVNTIPLAPEASSILASPKTSVSADALLSWVYRATSHIKEPLSFVQDSLEGALRSGSLSPQSSESLLQARREVFKSRALIDRLAAFSGKTQSDFESLDLEIFFREFEAANKDLQSTKTFFDPDIWRVKSDSRDLAILLKCYISFLQKKASPEQKVHVSARFMKIDPEDTGAIEIKRSSQFKVPFVRMIFQLKTTAPLGKSALIDTFELEARANQSSGVDIEIPLSTKIVDRLKCRLKAKSNFEDGNNLILDIPAFEERRAEDKINARQFSPKQKDDVPTPIVDTFLESTQNAKPVLAADKSAHESSRLKDFSSEHAEPGTLSRFRIRKPGVKE